MKYHQLDNLFQNSELNILTEPQAPKMDALFEVSQTHSTDIVLVPQEGSLKNLGVADGMIFLGSRPRPMAIKTADCLPVALIGKAGVGLIHAGWKGLAGSILSHPLIKRIEPQKAWIGPSICQSCYEVGQEFTTIFLNSDSLKASQGKLYLSLKDEARRLLTDQFPHLEVTLSKDCTRCHPYYHSHRRDQTPQRNWTVLQQSTIKKEST